MADAFHCYNSVGEAAWFCVHTDNGLAAPPGCKEDCYRLMFEAEESDSDSSDSDAGTRQRPYAFAPLVSGSQGNCS
jgi:hypothetical protein